MLRLPLKDRVLKSSNSHSSVKGRVVPFHYRADTYKHWTQDRMDKAVGAVEQGISVRRAAEEYDIPKSTLHDRVSGRVLTGMRSGLLRYLSDEEEKELESF